MIALTDIHQDYSSNRMAVHDCGLLLMDRRSRTSALRLNPDNTLWTQITGCLGVGGSGLAAAA